MQAPQHDVARYQRIHVDLAQYYLLKVSLLRNWKVVLFHSYRFCFQLLSRGGAPTYERVSSPAS